MPAYEEILRKAELPGFSSGVCWRRFTRYSPAERVGLGGGGRRCGPEVKEAAALHDKSLAGHGAVREAIELIMKSKGIWEEMIDKARA